MAGAPTAAVVTIGLPKDLIRTRVKIYNGLNALAKEYGVAIVGGENTTCPERMFISVAMIGLVKKSIGRGGAKTGDGVFRYR